MPADLANLIASIDSFLWGKVLLFVLVPCGLWFTIGTRFVQFRYFFRMFAILGEGFRHKGDQPTSFQALALSVAGRVGAGNIAGVAVAITLGGPGAIFWMWMVGLVGMATSFVECTLAQLYKRREHDGEFRGGPAHYIRYGLGKLLGPGAMALAGVYSILLLIAFGFAFNVLQSYSMTASVEEAFGVPQAATGAALALVVGVVIFGGVKRIASVAEIIVPVMALGYIAVVGYVLVTHLDRVPEAIGLIFSSAFGLNEAFGGLVGAAVVNGVKRGLFSNEAGLGSAPNVAAVAYVAHPAQQGMVQSLSVFIDTLIICTATATIILLSNVDFTDPDIGGVTLTQMALTDHVGGWANSFIAVALSLFVFSSIMYNYFLGENALDFFKDSKLLFNVYRLATLGFIMLGAVANLESAFGFANVAQGLLAVVNLFALLLLFPIAIRVMKDFDAQIGAKGLPVFDADDYADLDIDRSAWALQPQDHARLEARRKAKA